MDSKKLSIITEAVVLEDTMADNVVEVIVAHVVEEEEVDSEAIIEETVGVVGLEEASAVVVEAIRDRLVPTSTALGTGTPAT